MTTSPRLYKGGNPVNGVAPNMVPRTLAENIHFDRLLEQWDKERNLNIAKFNAQRGLERSDPEAATKFNNECLGVKDQEFWRWKSDYLLERVAREAVSTLKRENGIKIDAKDMDQACTWVWGNINAHAGYLKALYRHRVECHYDTSNQASNAWSEAEDDFRMAMAKPICDFWLAMKGPDANRISSTGISILAQEPVPAATANPDNGRPWNKYDTLPPPIIPQSTLANGVSAPSTSNTSDIVKAAETLVLMRSRKRPTHTRPEPTTEAGQELPSKKRSRPKKKGEDRDDKKNKGTIQFGYRLYNYFNYLSGDKKPEELLKDGVFADGEQILPDGTPSDVEREKIRLEAVTKPAKIATILSTAEKRHIYRIAKSQTAIAAVIYYEHNLRLQNQAAARGQSMLQKKELFNFNTTAVQYMMNRDSTVFGALFQNWSSWGLIPAMFPKSSEAGMPGTGMTEEMGKYGAEIRKRIYNQYVEWEKKRDDLEEKERILIEELPTAE